MKASELVKSLQDLILVCGDVKVIMQVDEEGNGYEIARGVELVYTASDTSHEYIMTSPDQAWEEFGFKESELIPALVVYP